MHQRKNVGKLNDGSKRIRFSEFIELILNSGEFKFQFGNMRQLRDNI